MPTETEAISQDVGTNRVLLIDLENCPAQIQYLPQNLADFSQVIICYAQTDTKIPLEWLIPLSATINSERLKIFKMTNVGKNAADFGICFFAGMLMQQLPENTHFVILSNDTDLDHVVNLLKSQQRSAERLGTRKEEKKSTTQTTQQTLTKVSNLPITSSLVTYCIYLLTYDQNRPVKRATLINSIKSKFKDDSQAATMVFELLLKHGAITVTAEKVSYHNHKIKEISNQS